MTPYHPLWSHEPQVYRQSTTWADLQATNLLGLPEQVRSRGIQQQLEGRTGLA